MAQDFNLERFLAAQEPIFSQVCAELKAGQKKSHWMWFIFPQIAGLGTSYMSQTFAISGLAEARAYLDHPVLASRLTQCCRLVLAIEKRSAVDVFGHIDSHKLQSSMTLFSHATQSDPIFKKVLQKYFDAREDQATLDILKSRSEDKSL